MNGTAITFVGEHGARRDRVADVLGRAPSLGRVEAIPLDDVLDHPAPRLAVLDAVGEPPEAAVAAIARLQLAWSASPLLVLSDDTEPVTVRAVLDAGATSILRDSARDQEVRATAEAALDGRGLVDVDVVRPVMDLYAQMHLDSRRRNRAVIESLAAAVEAKDSVTSKHLRAVSHLAIELARQIEGELCRDDDFLFGCLLHDVGKIGVPEHILTKPAALTDHEWQLMRRHPEIGATVVRPLGLPQTVTDVVLHHHERWDGAGYPHGLDRDRIPLAARIFSVCDALEAMTAARPYRPPIAMKVAYERVCLEGGHQFDPDVIRSLRRAVDDRSIDLEDPALQAPVAPGRRFSPAL